MYDIIEKFLTTLLHFYKDYVCDVEEVEYLLSKNQQALFKTAKAKTSGGTKVAVSLIYQSLK